MAGGNDAVSSNAGPSSGAPGGKAEDGGGGRFGNTTAAGAPGATGLSDDCGALTQAASIPTITRQAHPTTTRHRSRFMVLILLEALGALLVLVLIVWWTMFSGRRNGELPPPDAEPSPDDEAGAREPASSASGDRPSPRQR